MYVLSKRQYTVQCFAVHHKTIRKLSEYHEANCNRVAGSNYRSFPTNIEVFPQILFYAIWNKGFLDHVHLTDGMQWQKKSKKHIQGQAK